MSLSKAGRLSPGQEQTGPTGGREAGGGGSRLGALNIAAAYFIVNYSDVNCIVNKALLPFFPFQLSS